MEFDNSFEVPLKPAEAWTVLMDIRRIAPCMPGAELTEIVDEKNYKGKVAVRLGPVALAFAGLVTFEEIDNANRTARVKAQGTDAKGRGGANATASFRVEDAAGRRLEGAGAHRSHAVGLGRAIRPRRRHDPDHRRADHESVRQQPESADRARGGCARLRNAAPGQAQPPSSASPAAPPPAAKPISGFSLMAKVLWASILKLFGRRPS